ncbi:curli biogenesis system outer membrane secretion channel CsgG [Methanomicrobium sp. W14]|uniref:hypothetical protein n=1 Tax=Methanomicrobium sp. W14 TaxID=2817839 RepID=UPI001AE4B8AE|nr:hypothetical protein [Methanomicrobium sp. W14]MBP2133217.1 curli biogenesis system outer membrane secretion channel CsgG [Methanomicrobium sp. W14]
MKKYFMLIAVILLIAAAFVAIPASAGYVQGTDYSGCHGQALHQNCEDYSYGVCDGSYCYQNSGNTCLNSGTCSHCGGHYYRNCNCI